MTATETTPALQPFETAPTPAASRPTLSRSMTSFMINPGGVVKRVAGHLPVWAALSVPGAAFTLLFLQTGLDRVEVDTADSAKVALLCFVGFGYGTVGLALVAAAVAAVMRMMGGGHPNTTVTNAIALAYSPTLVYVVLGLLANLLFGWRTAVAFGVTGVVWAVAPLIGALRELSDGKTAMAVASATVSGTLVLLGWALLGGI